MRYVLLTMTGPEHTQAWLDATPEERQAEVAAVMDWFRRHGEAGRIVGGEELGWPRDARTVRVTGVTDGPFAETKELIAGYTLIEVRSRDEALAWARRFPSPFPGQVCEIEVRPLFCDGLDESAEDAERRLRDELAAIRQPG